MKIEFMEEALKEAKKAYDLGEIPVGAVVVFQGEVIARAHNKKETKKNSLKHAELVAIEKASERLGTWRLNDCEIYVSLEPCPMCAYAILNARFKKLYFGAYDKKSGGVESVVGLLKAGLFNHTVEYEGGLLEEESSEILKSFFKRLREENKSARRHI